MILQIFIIISCLGSRFHASCMKLMTFILSISKHKSRCFDIWRFLGISPMSARWIKASGDLWILAFNVRFRCELSFKFNFKCCFRKRAGPTQALLHVSRSTTDCAERDFLLIFAFIHVFIHWSSFAYYFSYFYSEIALYTTLFVLSYCIDVVFTIFVNYWIWYLWAGDIIWNVRQNHTGHFRS